jgi:hypothetical protein
MMLKPLEQFYCDVCGQVITNPHEGYVVWKRDEKRRGCDFQIIHHAKCDDGKSPSSLPLEDFLGPKGMIELLTLVDPGPYHVPDLNREYVKDMREWVEFVRRCQLPYYEEARRYWDRASSEYFEDVNDRMIYQPEYLRRMIEHYEK